MANILISENRQLIEQLEIALSTQANLYRILLEEKDETIEEQRQELEAKDEKIEEQRQELDDLKRERDCQPNYCENDGSSNCIMSRSRICSR